MIRVLALLFMMLVTPLCAQNSAGSTQESIVQRSISTLWDYLPFSIYDEFLLAIGFGQRCVYVPNMVKSVQNRLSNTIKGQDEAIDIVINAVAAWESRREVHGDVADTAHAEAGHSGPLILALTGSTGIGKTETSIQLAAALLARRTALGGSTRYTPEGHLVLRGEDYSQRRCVHSQTLIPNTAIEWLLLWLLLNFYFLRTRPLTQSPTDHSLTPLYSPFLSILDPALQWAFSCRNALTYASKTCKTLPRLQEW